MSRVALGLYDFSKVWGETFVLHPFLRAISQRLLPEPLCISQSGFSRSKSLPGNTGTITLRLEDEFKYQPKSEKLR